MSLELDESKFASYSQLTPLSSVSNLFNVPILCHSYGNMNRNKIDFRKYIVYIRKRIRAYNFYETKFQFTEKFETFEQCKNSGLKKSLKLLKILANFTTSYITVSILKIKFNIFNDDNFHCVKDCKH